ncbi:MAG: SRPBCC family protein [Myxococcales bacterium]
MPNDITIAHEFPNAPEIVFAALDDHANMGSWLGGKITVAKRVPDGGVGTVRRIHLGPMNFDEEVIERQIPSRIVYRISRGVPFLRHHRGEIQVEPNGRGGARVRWNVALETTLPGVSGAFRSGLGLVLKQGLRRLERRLPR